MKTDETDLHPRQRAVIQLIARGSSQAKAGREYGMDPTSVCRLIKRPAARAYLDSLIAETETDIRQLWPGLVRRAMETLALGMEGRMSESQLSAATAVLKLATKMTKPRSSIPYVLDDPGHDDDPDALLPSEEERAPEYETDSAKSSGYGPGLDYPTPAESRYSNPTDTE